MMRLLKTSLLIGIILVLALSLSACAAIDIQIETLTGSGNVITQERNVRGFNQVLLVGSGELTITQGDTESLTITADDNLMDYIQSTVDGSTLMLGIDVDDLSDVITTYNPTRLEYDLVVKDLSSLHLAGSGNASMESLTTGKLILTVAGSGNIAITDLVASSVETNVPGTGNVELSGSTPNQMVTLAGSGNYIAPDLGSETAHVFIGGSGNATVWASEELDINIAGSGQVNYYGLPTVKQQILGSGEVKALGDK
jgi:hypothetical protein